MMKRFNSGPRRGAFTLVELLVVIGIIALLISILLPALNKAREQANIAKCASSMRSAVQALLIYTTENKGWLPGPHTSGARWNSSAGVASVTLTDTSSDETPLQNMDWVSPTFGKTVKWPENEYQRLRAMYNFQLNCPSNSVMWTDLGLTSGLPYGGDLSYSSFAAVIQFHAFPIREKAKGRTEPEVGTDFFDQNGNGTLTVPPSYVPTISKVGPPASKVFLVEGSRYVELANAGTFNATATKTSFNGARFQRVGGNFMVGGPFLAWPNTPFQIYEGSTNYTSKKISPVAKNYAWRHNGKMNLGFFDGHVELRSVSDSISVSLYTPKGTIINKSSDTYDPNDRDGQIVN